MLPRLTSWKAGKANSRKKKFYEKQKQEEKVEEKQK
jgi:hypothetical protein